MFPSPPQSIPLLIGMERRNPYFCLSRAAFRYAQGCLFLFQAPFMDLAYGKLCIIQMVACFLPDLFVDSSYFRRQLFRSRIKQRLELVLDTLRNQNTERVQILGYGTDGWKAFTA